MTWRAVRSSRAMDRPRECTDVPSPVRAPQPRSESTRGKENGVNKMRGALALTLVVLVAAGSSSGYSFTDVAIEDWAQSSAGAAQEAVFSSGASGRSCPPGNRPTDRSPVYPSDHKESADLYRVALLRVKSFPGVFSERHGSWFAPVRHGPLSGWPPWLESSWSEVPDQKRSGPSYRS